MLYMAERSSVSAGIGGLGGKVDILARPILCSSVVGVSSSQDIDYNFRHNFVYGLISSYDHRLRYARRKCFVGEPLPFQLVERQLLFSAEDQLFVRIKNDENCPARRDPSTEQAREPHRSGITISLRID